MSANRFMFRGDVDTNPAQTRRLVLEVLASTDMPMVRRAIQQAVWHTDTYGAGQTIQALLWLLEHGFITRTTAKPYRYSVTVEGVAALELSEVFDPVEHPSGGVTA